MPIDIKTPGSPGWWMNRLALRLQRDRKRFDILEDHFSGRPPLPWGSEDVKSRFYRFQQTSRTNFAALIVQARSERVGLRAVRTAAPSDSVDNDASAWRVITANGLDVAFPNAARTAWKFGRAYLAAAEPLDAGGPALITAEDPRCMIAETDPMTGRVCAAFKLFHDSANDLDVAILWLPGEKHVAVRQRTAPVHQQRSDGLLGLNEPLRISFTASGFDMRPTEQADGGVTDGYYSETYQSKDIPVREVATDDGVGVFELHIDLLNRLNHLSFMLLVITTLQAFRQRGVETDPEHPLAQNDEQGKPIDYNDLFESGPDSLWLLPAGAKVWESGQVDLSGLLNAIKAALLMLSAVTRTPMSMFTPDAATQTAEGAQLQREGIVFGIESFLRVGRRALAEILGIAFSYMGDSVRSDASRIEVDFLPVERYSLAERGSATAQSVTLPLEDVLQEVWQMSPERIQEVMAHRAAEQMQQLVAAAQAAAAGVSASAAPKPPVIIDDQPSA